METRAAKKKLSLKERYVAMTRGLAWDTTYQPMEKVFPFDRYEGIRIHDWNLWEDPFRLTMDTYWKYQGEKDKKLYAVIDAFAQNNGHMGISDARYVNAIKLFIQGVTPVEYGAHRGFAHVGRQFVGAGPRVACQLQAVDELRHFQTETHAMSHYNRYFNGMHAPGYWFDHVWYLSVPKSFFEDAFTSGPFEFLTAISFSFEYVLTNLLFVPFMSGAAYNGDMATVTFGFSAQSDESRHMTLGIECIKFMLEQDPGNVPIVQRWIDKWFWRGYRLLTLVAMMQDYMLPRKVISWKKRGRCMPSPTAARCSRTWRATASESREAGKTPARARSTSAIKLGRCSISTRTRPRSTHGCRQMTRCGGSRRNIQIPSIAITAAVSSIGATSSAPRGVGSTSTCRCCAKSARSP